MVLIELLKLKGLTNRQAEVAEKVSQGLSNKQVAKELFVEEKTVKYHLTDVYSKLGLKSRAELIVWCLSPSPASAPYMTEVDAMKVLPKEPLAAGARSL